MIFACMRLRTPSNSFKVRYNWDRLLCQSPGTLILDVIVHATVMAERRRWREEMIKRCNQEKTCGSLPEGRLRFTTLGLFLPH